MFGQRMPSALQTASSSSYSLIVSLHLTVALGPAFLWQLALLLLDLEPSVF